ncbi:MAG TPA: helix-turn-helix domain-containing protein [Armatimonadota bacterium]|nr:helix-turn-helix domain-containing protein [Armatimonadota bacterium]
MIHCETALDVELRGGAATPARLVLCLSADTGPGGYQIRGVIEIEGLDAWRMDAFETELTRRLGGRCTLVLGPADLDNLLDGRNVEHAAREIARTYHWSARDLADKVGVAVETAQSLLTETHARNAPTCRLVAALALRLVQAPTPGEVLRRERRDRPRRTVASDIGVEEETLRRWEDDEELVPYELADRVRRVLGIPRGVLVVALPMLPGGAYEGEPTTPAAIKAARRQLGLSQPRFAALLGVHSTTISSWERGANRPTGRPLRALCRALGVAQHRIKPAEIRTAREALGYSQTAVAARCGVTQGAVQAWESGRAAPDPAHLRLLLRALDLDDPVVPAA